MCFKSGRSLVRRKEAHQRMSPEEELLRLEKEFAEAVVKNDPEAIAQFMKQDFSTQERSTDFFVKVDGRWQCVLTQLTRFAK